MSNLTEALNRIMSWLEQYQPEYAASFLPGLSRQKIDELVAPLNVLIPEEIYELYQWRNGRAIEPFSTYGRPSFSIYEYLPLQEALEPNFIDWINLPLINGGFLTSEYENKILFPFLGHLDPEICVVVISNKLEENYPVIVLFEAQEPVLYCPSITSMMSIYAEAYETEAYYLDDKDSRTVHTNPDKLLKILKKYKAYID